MRSLRGKAWLALLGASHLAAAAGVFATTYHASPGRSQLGVPLVAGIGDHPHVVAYCSVIVADRLVTSHQDPSIPCEPDLVGSEPLLYPPSP